jgi:putative membrane protein
MSVIFKWLLSALAVLIAAYLLPGVVVASIWTAIVVALVLALLNVVIKPILIILTLPINLLTLGLFTFWRVPLLLDTLSMEFVILPTV